MRVVPILAVLLLATACASTSPVPIHAGDVCFHCRRTIDNPALAAEVIDAGRHAFKFSSVGCLRAYLRDHPDDGSGTIFVTDYGTGKLFGARQAFFVRFVVQPRTRTQDFAAFRVEGVARSFAAEKKASGVLRWQDVLRDDVAALVH